MEEKEKLTKPQKQPVKKKKKKKKKKNDAFSTILLILVFVVGLSLLLYPSLSDYWNSLHQSKAIATYSESVSKLQEDEYKKLLEDATWFNEYLRKNCFAGKLTDKEMEMYKKTLDVSGTGIMGYIDIPSIDVSLPIYHTVEEDVLQIAVGHIEWSSLPIGGKNTHCVLSGHRGLPSAKLFSNLDKLSKGDEFMLHILNETLTYRVDQILIVEPKDVKSLIIEPGKDLCTLVTCTPYGVNSHRLLVRGHRIENIKETPTINIVSEAAQIEPLLVAPLIAAPILLALLVLVLLRYRKKK